MRGYTEKAAQYRLPKERLDVLRAFCRSANGDDLELIRDIADETVHDALADWIVLAETSDRWPWARLEANHIPCSQQTFRLYRKRFYYLLDPYIDKRGRQKSTPRSRW